MYFIDMCFLIVESHVTNSEQGQFQTTCSSRDILVQFFSSPLLDVLFADTRTPEHMVVLVTLQDRPLHATEYTPLSPRAPPCIAQKHFAFFSYSKKRLFRGRHVLAKGTCKIKKRDTGTNQHYQNFCPTKRL